MPNLRKAQEGERYIIVEGGGKQRTGICVNHVESSFGRIWVDLQMEDEKEIMRKRLDDVRSKGEIEEQLAEKRRSEYQRR